MSVICSSTRYSSLQKLVIIIISQIDVTFLSCTVNVRAKITRFLLTTANASDIVCIDVHTSCMYVGWINTTNASDDTKYISTILFWCFNGNECEHKLISWMDLKTNDFPLCHDVVTMLYHNVATMLILRWENNAVATLSQCRHNVDFTSRKQCRHDIVTMSPQCWFYVEKTTSSRHCHNVSTMLWNNVVTTLSQCRHNVVKQRRHDIVTMSPQYRETTSPRHCHNVATMLWNNIVTT